jgi:hypothetical protein
VRELIVLPFFGLRQSEEFLAEGAEDGGVVGAVGGDGQDRQSVGGIGSMGSSSSGFVARTNGGRPL